MAMAAILSRVRGGPFISPAPMQHPHRTPPIMAMTLAYPTFTAGMVLSMSLIMAIGPQNAHVLRMGLQRQHVWLTVAVCMVSDMVLIGLGVFGLAQLGGLSDKLMGALVGAGSLFLAVYGWKAFRRFLHPQPVAVAVGTDGARPAAPAMTRRQAVGAALAFSWLNPHAWLDTAVLIGSASLAYGAGAGVFGMGAAAAQPSTGNTTLHCPVPLLGNHSVSTSARPVYRSQPSAPSSIAVSCMCPSPAQCSA